MKPAWLMILLAALLAGCTTTGGVPTLAPTLAVGPAPTQPTPTPARALVNPANETPTPVVAVNVVADANAPAVPEFFVAVPTFSADDPLRFIFPTPIILPTPVNWRPPVVQGPLARHPYDHFWFARPIASDRVNWPLGSYRYGSDYFGQMNIHAGIDIGAPLDTPVLAAADGEVVWAGWGLFTFDPTNIEDPYGIAVAVRHDFGYNGQPLYTLYAHLAAQNDLYVGQRVRQGDVLGWIGVTGNTTGAHLHFEVRQGANGYYNTRNPELWLAPYADWGVLAGQVLDRGGNLLSNVRVLVENQRGQTLHVLFTYGDRVANPDDLWQENFAIADLPAGDYNFKFAIPQPGQDLPEVISGSVRILPGQTNFVRLQLLRDAELGLTPVFQNNLIPTPRGLPPYPTNTFTPSPSPTATFTPSATRTPRPSASPTLTRTPRPSPSATLTRTPTPSLTPRP